MAKLSGGMLLLGGHLTDPETVRLLARDETPLAQIPQRGYPTGNRAPRNRDWRAPLEMLMLAATIGGSFACIALGALTFAGTLPL